MKAKIRIMIFIFFSRLLYYSFMLIFKGSFSLKIFFSFGFGFLLTDLFTVNRKAIFFIKPTLFSGTDLGLDGKYFMEE